MRNTLYVMKKTLSVYIVNLLYTVYDYTKLA